MGRLLAVAGFVVVVDYAGVVILLPPILADLGGGLDGITWVLGIFPVVFSVLLLPCRWLAERVGPRLLLPGGLGLLGLGSLVAALAQSLGPLVAVRAVQGAAAAAVEGSALVVLSTTGETRARLLRVRAAGFFLGGALGPLLPGALAVLASWRAFFALNAALGVLTLVAALRLRAGLPGRGGHRRWSPAGVLATAAASVASVLVFLGLVEGHRLGWASPPVLGSLLAGALLLAAFVAAQARGRDRPTAVGLFRDRRYAVGSGVRAGTEFVSLGIFLPLSHFLQVDLGYSALVAGLVLTAVIGGALLSAPAAESLGGRVDVRWLVMPGFALVALGTAGVAEVSTSTGWVFLVLWLAVVGVGVGALEGPSEHGTARGIPAEATDHADGVSYVVYLVGIWLGVAVVSAVWQSASADAATAVSAALLTCAGVAVLGLVVSALFASRPQPG